MLQIYFKAVLTICETFLRYFCPCKMSSKRARLPPPPPPPPPPSPSAPILAVADDEDAACHLNQLATADDKLQIR